ncbi:MAG: hypothetical protein ACOY99_06150 [Pseudomonadota bacterium]
MLYEVEFASRLPFVFFYPSCILSAVAAAGAARMIEKLLRKPFHGPIHTAFLVLI